MPIKDSVKASIISFRVQSELVNDCNGVSLLHILDETGLRWRLELARLSDQSDYLVVAVLRDRAVARIVVGEVVFSMDFNTLA